MKKTTLIFITVFTIYCIGNSQGISSPVQSCSVILLNDHWIINSYNKEEKAILDISSKGILSVHETGNVFYKSFKAETLEFKISILKKSGQVEEIFPGRFVKSVKAEDVLKKCQVGDKIIFVVKNPDKFFLPHNEIEVQDGC